MTTDSKLAGIRSLADAELERIGVPKTTDEDMPDVKVGCLKAQDAVRQATGVQYTFLGLFVALLLYALSNAVASGNPPSLLIQSSSQKIEEISPTVDTVSLVAYIVLTVLSAIGVVAALFSKKLMPNHDSIFGRVVAIQVHESRSRDRQERACWREHVEFPCEARTRPRAAWRTLARKLLRTGREGVTKGSVGRG